MVMVATAANVLKNYFYITIDAAMWINTVYRLIKMEIVWDVPRDLCHMVTNAYTLKVSVKIMAMIGCVIKHITGFDWN